MKLGARQEPRPGGWLDGAGPVRIAHAHLRPRPATFQEAKYASVWRLLACDIMLYYSLNI
jgi:hypothetical protein